MLKTNPNWLLCALIGVSLGIHFVIFMHIAGIYRSSTLTYIELFLEDVSRPPTRSIPRPRHRAKEPFKPRDVKRLDVMKKPIHSFKPIKVEPVERDLSESLVESIGIPDIPATPDLNIVEWTPAKMGETSGDYATSDSYQEMVTLKIERCKQYPDLARIRHMEGSVTIRFVITPEGDVRDAKILETSRHRVLDEAALKAVRDAAPFPKPPVPFFVGDLSVDLPIVFELL